MPDTFSGLSEKVQFLKFDPTGTLSCLINQFEFTFYHNVLLQATIPLTIWIVVRGIVQLGNARLRIKYNNHRRIAEDDEEMQQLDRLEENAREALNETAVGLSSELLIFLHPNTTEVMFNMFSCIYILGYDRPWLAQDLRFQCYDRSWFTFAAIAILIILTYSMGLPIMYFISLRRRRHRLDEAKSVVIKQYVAWRQHLKRAHDLRISEDELAGSEEIARVDRDIKTMHFQYQLFRNQWDNLEFLYNDYKLQFYYWELVEMLRKQLIVAVSSIIALAGPGYDVIFGCLVSFVFLALHTAALPYTEARENFVKGGEIGTTYLTLFSALLLLLADASPDYRSPLFDLAITGSLVIFFSVVTISISWNVRQGFADIALLREEAERKKQGTSDKIDIFSIFFAVKLLNNAMRKKVHQRYDWDLASSGGSSALSSVISSHQRSGKAAEEWEEAEEEEGWHALMLAHVQDRWISLRDRLVLIKSLGEPENSSQASEVGMLSEDSASALEDWFEEDGEVRARAKAAVLRRAAVSDGESDNGGGRRRRVKETRAADTTP